MVDTPHTPRFCLFRRYGAWESKAVDENIAA